MCGPDDQTPGADTGRRDIMLKQYYSIHRPVGPGTFPKDGMIGFINYDRRTFIPEIGREAWATLAFDRELTRKEMESYELVPHPENSEN